MEAAVKTIAVCQVLMAIVAIMFIAVGIGCLVFMYRIKKLTEKNAESLKQMVRKLNDLTGDASVMFKQMRSTTENVGGKIDSIAAAVNSIVANVNDVTETASNVFSGFSNKVSGAVSPKVIGAANTLGIGVKLFTLIRALIKAGKNDSDKK
ncbi:MAG: hypothetical protein J6X38_08985 [Abditibacteriota bacterium]|nr:hypothetical protein [Abditibacteriota bacterium]